MSEKQQRQPLRTRHFSSGLVWSQEQKRERRTSRILWTVLQTGNSLTRWCSDVKKNGTLAGRIFLITHRSAIKRHRQSLKKRARNVEVKSRLRTLIKKTHRAIEAQDRDETRAQISVVNKALSKAVSKGIIKRNTASRWLSRLSRSATHVSK